VIKTFGGRHGADTKEFWDTGKSQGMPSSNLRRVAKRKLQMLNAATQLNDLLVPLGNKLEKLEDDCEGSTAFASTINTASVSCGKTKTPTRWK
jgi:plasmid maintenance system killer protein